MNKQPSKGHKPTLIGEMSPASTNTHLTLISGIPRAYSLSVNTIFSTTSPSDFV